MLASVGVMSHAMLTNGHLVEWKMYCVNLEKLLRNIREVAYNLPEGDIIEGSV